MGNCCKAAADKWTMDYSPTELSSNKCDAEWEEMIGEQATFGMGSHWGPCARFGAVHGVIRVRVGFTGGVEPNPTYNEPKDHTEAVNLQYDPNKISYEKLLQIFWDYHDWTLDNETPQYASYIFYHDDRQKVQAESSLAHLISKTEKPVHTKVSTYTQFWAVDDEYQHYMLQQQRKVFERLKIKPNQLAHSHLAAKVEGYVCGYAPPDNFDDEVMDFYLPDGLANLIRSICESNQPAEVGGDKFPV